MRNQGLFNWQVRLVAYQHLGPGSKLWLMGTLKAVILSPGMCQVCFVGGEDRDTERKWCTSSLQGSSVFLFCCFYSGGARTQGLVQALKKKKKLYHWPTSQAKKFSFCLSISPSSLVCLYSAHSLWGMSLNKYWLGLLFKLLCQCSKWGKPIIVRARYFFPKNKNV